MESYTIIIRITKLNTDCRSQSTVFLAAKKARVRGEIGRGAKKTTTYDLQEKVGGGQRLWRDMHDDCLKTTIALENRFLVN